MWQDTDWGKDLKFTLRNQIMAHYLLILQDSTFLLENIKTSNDSAVWINEEFYPYKEKTQSIQKDINAIIINHKSLYGKMSFGQEQTSPQEIKGKDICVYTGDFNGDGISDYAFLRCMSPYPQAPKVNICFNQRDKLAPSCIQMAVDLGQSSDGIGLNKMPDLNRDGLTDFISFSKLDSAHFHLNELSDVSLIEMAFTQSEEGKIKVEPFDCQPGRSQGYVGDVSQAFAGDVVLCSDLKTRVTIYGLEARSNAMNVHKVKKVIVNLKSDELGPNSVIMTGKFLLNVDDEFEELLVH